MVQQGPAPWGVGPFVVNARDPFSGIGKLEPLKYHLPGAWSRRIDDEHRLVYLVTDQEIVILAARYHY